MRFFSGSHVWDEQEFGGDEAATLVNSDSQLKNIAELLEIEEQSFRAALCSLTSVTRGT
jgi:hypothetical protein